MSSSLLAASSTENQIYQNVLSHLYTHDHRCLPAEIERRLRTAGPFQFEYVEHAVLGRGAQGCVTLVSPNPHHVGRCRPEVPVTALLAAKVQGNEVATREAVAMAMISPCPSVAALVDVLPSEVPGECALICPFAPYATLIELYVEQYSLARFPKTRKLMSDLECAVLSVQLLGALAHVHSCGVAHGDIKPDNILVRDLSVMRDSEVRIVTDDVGQLEFVKVTSFGTIVPAKATLPSGLSLSKCPCEDAYKSAKSSLPVTAGSTPGGDAGDCTHLLPRIALADFGHSIVVGQSPPGTAFAYQGTPQYRAPEVRGGTRVADPFAADLWAAGMTLLVHLCGGLMFDSALLRSRSPAELQRGRLLMAALLQEFTHPFIMAAPLEQVAAAQQAGYVECSMLEVERLRKQWMSLVSSVIYRDITYRPVRSDAPAGAVDLVLRCLLQRDPEDRLPARDLVSHKWLVEMLGPLAVSEGFSPETDSFSIAATNSTVSDTHSMASSASGSKRGREHVLEEESGMTPLPKRGRHSPLNLSYTISC